MNLQESISKAMNEVSSEIKATTKSTKEANEKLHLLRASIGKVVNLSPDDIVIESNVRHRVDEQSSEFKKLCESIKTFGLMENIVADLKVSDDDSSYKLVCVAGHRRLAALRHLGLLKEKIPCLIKQYSNSDMVGAALSENLNREGLGCIDIADGYQRLIDSGWNQEDLVKHFEKNKKTIAHYLRLAQLPNDIKTTIRENGSIFTSRMLFNSILAKNKLPGDIRKAVNRKLELKNPKKETKKDQIKDKLLLFFEEKQLIEKDQTMVLDAFKFVGLLS